jgi:flagellar basal-body rod protein FlgC
MSMFPSIGIAGTGLDVDQTWIDTISSNVANADDAVTPGSPVYQEQEVVATASPSQAGATGGAEAGVQVAQVATSTGQGVLASDPTSPLANAAGLVEYPDVNIGHEMASLVQAQTDYEANANVISNSDDAYKAILAIKA